ncbi:MAG: ATP-binding protein [Patescibacteria group bacterium]|nr:ATP-binding protein [Patescibacteria group bacterium]
MPNSSIQQLRELARECQSYQLERGLSDAKFCSKVSQAGSTKTYKRILDASDALEELNIEKQLENYQAAVEYIRVLRASDRPAEKEFEDFANVTDSLAAIARALQEDSIARFVVIEGENGTGKDAVKNALLRKWNKITIAVEATELWRDSAVVPMADIINALGVRRQSDEERGEPFKMPMHPQPRLELIREELNRRKLILLINEGHHCGPRGLNLIKTLINQSPVVIVLACIPKLLSRLVNSNYEEAIQLFGNRLCERVRLPSPPTDEIVELFARREVRFMDAATANAAAQAMAAEAPQFGNWRFVIQVCREARDLATGKPLNLKQFSDAAAKARARRIMQQRNGQ